MFLLTKWTRRHLEPTCHTSPSEATFCNHKLGAKFQTLCVFCHPGIFSVKPAFFATVRLGGPILRIVHSMRNFGNLAFHLEVTRAGMHSLLATCYRPQGRTSANETFVLHQGRMHRCRNVRVRASAECSEGYTPARGPRLSSDCTSRMTQPHIRFSSEIFMFFIVSTILKPVSKITFSIVHAYNKYKLSALH